MAPRLRATLAARYPSRSLPEIRALDGVDDDPALYGSLVALCLRPARQGLPGQAAATPEALREADALRPPCPARHLLSAFLDHLAAGREGRLRTRGSRRDAVRLRSASGPTAGSSLVAPMHREGGNVY